jgi:hypothetical protein
MLQESIVAALEEVESLDPTKRRAQRRAKYRLMGTLASA